MTKRFMPEIASIKEALQRSYIDDLAFEEILEELKKAHRRYRAQELIKAMNMGTRVARPLEYWGLND